jgi:cytochrome b
LLAIVSVQAITGLCSDDQEYFFGPLSGYLSGSLVSQVTEFHHFNFNVILAVIILHVAAILFYALVRKEPLVPAMLTGYKKDPQQRLEGIASSKPGRAIVLLAVAAGIVYAISTLGG